MKRNNNADTRTLEKENVAYPGDSRSLRLDEPFSREHYKDRPGIGVRTAPFVPCVSIGVMKCNVVSIERVHYRCSVKRLWQQFLGIDDDVDDLQALGEYGVSDGRIQSYQLLDPRPVPAE
jgi:hypothetical protein